MESESTGLLLISILTIIAYIIMLLLKRYKIISPLFHKRILNIALLVSFVITAYSGIAYALIIDYGISIGETDNHISWGIFMILVGIIHTIEQKWFFTNMLKFKKKD